MKLKTIFALTALIPLIGSAQTETVKVTLDPTTIRNIGGVTKFDRDQWITIHESFGSGDMSENDFHYLDNVLQAKYGRDGGFISWMAGETKARKDNPDAPDFATLDAMLNKWYSEVEPFRIDPKHMRDVVLCAHPNIMHGIPANKSTEWGPRSYEAAAEFTAQLLKKAFTDENRPQFLEVFNEPFVHAEANGTTARALSEQHNVVAKRVRELNPDVKVGGYAAAWIEVEQNNFDHWNNWQKMFMDVAGENMDFFSYHIYDGVNVKGTPANRTGSNSEAIMDLIDTYSHIKFGVAKPLMITEYGKIPGGNMSAMAYSPERSAGMLYSAMGQLITFMDHPDRYMKTIPFFLGRAMWTYDMTPNYTLGHANPYLLWRKNADGEFVETDLTLFYQFWIGVEGDWRESATSNPDVRVHLLADGNRLNVVLMNLDTENKSVALDGLENLKAKKISIRTLEMGGKAPVLEQRTMDLVPSKIALDAGEAALLMIDLEPKKYACPFTRWFRSKDALKTTEVTKEHRVYATEYLKDIKANKPVNFTFNDVPVGKGSAVLRLSPGRIQGKQILPTSVKINGKSLEIPTNWAGCKQEGRPNFFGMLELPVPMETLQETSNVEIIYPDSGGKVACVVLQVNRAE